MTPAAATPGPPLSRRWRSAVRAGAVGWLAVLLGGCAAAVSCPALNGDGRAVFLLDHGRHASLMVENADGALVRYSYGDWRFYALNDPGFWNATRALLWRTPAGLGRSRAYDVPPTAPAVRRALRVGVPELFQFEVAAARADALHAEFGSVFAGARDSHYNADWDLEFVRHPRDYWAWYNSNHMVADWMRRLDCEVRGTTLWSNWHAPDSVAP